MKLHMIGTYKSCCQCRQGKPKVKLFEWGLTMIFCPINASLAFDTRCFIVAMPFVQSHAVSVVGIEPWVA